MEYNQKEQEENQVENLELETKIREEDWAFINKLYGSSFEELVER